MIEFIVPGEPKAKGRPKFARRGSFVTTYTPEATANYENWIKLCFQKAYPDWSTTEVQLRVEIKAYFEVPKSKSKKIKELMLDNAIRPTKKPDCDNLAKVIDSLNGIVWKDDAQVVSLTVDKYYSDIARMVISITEVI